MLRSLITVEFPRSRLCTLFDEFLRPSGQFRDVPHSAMNHPPPPRAVALPSFQLNWTEEPSSPLSFPYPLPPSHAVFPQPVLCLIWKLFGVLLIPCPSGNLSISPDWQMLAGFLLFSRLPPSWSDPPQSVKLSSSFVSSPVLPFRLLCRSLSYGHIFLPLFHRPPAPAVFSDRPFFLSVPPFDSPVKTTTPSELLITVASDFLSRFPFFPSILFQMILQVELLFFFPSSARDFFFIDFQDLCRPLYVPT